MAGFKGRMQESYAPLTLLLTFLSYRDGGTTRELVELTRKVEEHLEVLRREAEKPPLLRRLLFGEGAGGAVPAEEFLAVTPTRVKMHDVSLWRKIQWIWQHRSKA